MGEEDGWMEGWRRSSPTFLHTFICFLPSSIRSSSAVFMPLFSSTFSPSFLYSHRRSECPLELFFNIHLTVLLIFSSSKWNPLKPRLTLLLSCLRLLLIFSAGLLVLAQFLHRPFVFLLLFNSLLPPVGASSFPLMMMMMMMMPSASETGSEASSETPSALPHLRPLFFC